MLEGLFAAASGMSAQQQQLDAVSNNIANGSTNGYQAENVAFGDLLYNEVNEAGTVTRTGAGASARQMGFDEATGALQQTGNPLDLAIKGRGYFEVKQPGGPTLLTRDGAFTTDAQGRLVTAEGAYVQPPITLPPGVSPSEVTIGPGGEVTAAGRTLGKIAIVDVPAPNGLLAAGGGQFSVTAASGQPVAAQGSTLIQGTLEGSNVNLADEMTTMVSDQRSYQMSGTAVKIEGEMMSIANQLVTP